MPKTAAISCMVVFLFSINHEGTANNAIDCTNNDRVCRFVSHNQGPSTLDPFPGWIIQRASATFPVSAIIGNLISTFMLSLIHSSHYFFFFNDSILDFWPSIQVTIFLNVRQEPGEDMCICKVNPFQSTIRQKEDH